MLSFKFDIEVSKHKKSSQLAPRARALLAAVAVFITSLAICRDGYLAGSSTADQEEFVDDGSSSYDLSLEREVSADGHSSSARPQQPQMAAALPPTMRGVVASAGRCALSGALPLPALRPHELLLRVAYSAINRADTLQRLGKYSPPPGASQVLGLEAAGIVVAHGAAVGAAAPPVGARAMALLSGGGNAEFVACDWRHAMAVPERLSLREAAAIPETFLTAFQLLHLVGRAQPGEAVVVHAAGSGVGTAAVQLAAAHGLRVVAVAGAEAKLATARRLGAAAAVNYKESKDWAADVLAAIAALPPAPGSSGGGGGGGGAGGGGADLILDPVGASFWECNARALAVDGRWVLYGSLGGSAVEGPLFARLMAKRAQLLATTLRNRSDDYKAALVAAFAERALPGLAAGALAPVIDAEFELADAQAAHERMESDVGNGKILLRVFGE